jgi:magnesium chelatase subunit D
MRKRLEYPFSAIVGQPEMKRALILNAINPQIGGLLLRGEKGTAKSLAVRALAGLLPQIDAVAGCRFACEPGNRGALCDECVARVAGGAPLESEPRRVPVVELPLGATEDRVVGTIDIERAIKEGVKKFEAGILARANRGILYIDEVNLLDDHLVDVLLDAAAMGVNYVEREGISFRHPARFILIGTMNPEEGELRPQLLDRFGLSVEIKGIKEASSRADVVKRRIAYENDPSAFIEAWEPPQAELRSILARAKVLLPEVKLADNILELITRLCLDFNVDGHRADIVMYKTACTLTAFHGRREVLAEDVREAAELALAHRRRRKPFEEPGLNQNQLKQTMRDWQRDQKKQPGAKNPQTSREVAAPQHHSETDDDDSEGPHPAPGKLRKEEIFASPESYSVKPITLPRQDNRPRAQSGRRLKSRTKASSGRYVASVLPRGKVRDLAFDATLRAAAPHQRRRRLETASAAAILVEKPDLRQKVREKKVGSLVIFVIDASGSMAARRRMKAAKGAVLSLLTDAYQRRDRAAMIVFRGEKAALVLPPTDSLEMAEKYLAQMATGGQTPLAHGLKLALGLIGKQRRRDGGLLPLLVLVSDGRGNVALNGGDPLDDVRALARRLRQRGIRAVGIDTETGSLRLGLMARLCDDMGAAYYQLEDIRDNTLLSVVRANVG